MGPNTPFPHSSPVAPSNADTSDPGANYTPEEVNLRPAGDSETSCGSCAHYLGDGICEIVTTSVRPDDVCDMWEPRSYGLGDLIGPGG